MHTTTNLVRRVSMALAATLVVVASTGASQAAPEDLPQNLMVTPDVGPDPGPPMAAEPFAIMTAEARGGTTIHFAVSWRTWEPTYDGQPTPVWDLGDGTVITGSQEWKTDHGVHQLDHTYASPGRYTVTVNVTDSWGATLTDTKTIMVGKAVGLAPFDDGSSFSSALVGGPWITSRHVGLPDPYGGTLLLQGPGSLEGAFLSETWTEDVDVTTRVNLESTSSGRVSFLLAARHRDDGHYAVKLDHYPQRPRGTQVTMRLVRFIHGKETLLASAPVDVESAFTAAQINPIDPIPSYYRQGFGTVRLQVTSNAEGSSTLQAKAWPSHQPEPSEWTITAQDRSPELRRAGQVGVEAYLSRESTEKNIRVRIAQLEANPVWP